MFLRPLKDLIILRLATDHTLFRIESKSNKPVKGFFYCAIGRIHILLMAQADRVTEYIISKLKFLSPSTVSLNFEPQVCDNNITLSSFTATVLCWKHLLSVTATMQWKLDFFYRLAYYSGKGNNVIALLNRTFMTEKVLWSHVFTSTKDSVLSKEDESYGKWFWIFSNIILVAGVW